MNINLLDWVIIGIILFSVGAAFLKGVVAELVSLSSVVVGLVLAIIFYSEAGALWSIVGVGQVAGHFLGFTSIFLLSMVAGWILIRLADSVLRTLRLKWIDRLLGALFGLLRGWLIALAIFLSLTAFPVGGRLVGESTSGEFFLTSAKLVMNWIPGSFRDRFDEGYNKIYSQWIEETS